MATLEEKRTVLVYRTAKVFDIYEEDAEMLLGAPKQQSVRLNPLRYAEKAALLQAVRALGYEAVSSGLDDDCYFISGDITALRDSELVAGGEAYIQNASSWLPVMALDPRPNEKILDITAAPGGKASHIAARTNNQAELWVNDNSRPRIAKMKANFKRMNVRPSQITLHTIQSLPTHFESESFDKILLDAPCSGEGLIDITNPKTYATWSVAHIKRLQTLQKRAIMNAWQLLRPGGTLVYSTCTIAPDENEVVIDHLLRKNDNVCIVAIDFSGPQRSPAVRTWNGKQLDERLKSCFRTVPSERFEAFFVAKIIKLSSPDL
jgi:16S rRNA (cytosine1407-C5)-methyltransferase